MDRLDALRSFLAVADLASFAAAARALRCSPAAATRAVAMIEAELGVVLLHRTTRVVRLTEAGALYAEHGRRILADMEAARSLVRGEHASPRGTLSVTAPVVFGRLHVLPIAEALAAAHPALAIRLTLVDRVTHLVEEGFDIGVRIGALPDSALVAVPLTQVRRVVVASPAYLATHGEPRSPDELRHHAIIAFDGLEATDAWRFAPPGQTAGASVRVAVSPRLIVNSADAATAAALHGRGITRVLSYQVEEAVRDDRLRHLLRAHEPPSVPVSLVFQASRRSSANIIAFVREARMQFHSPTFELAPRERA
ncbi:LysR substrate-binding domain-containing protein [Roseomonas rosulenta]|uniref:LysR substrate-binding domain-containing protein n=1 Tax=Roseomonas rosulenta TaxID=2748667 RepID=UPI0018DF0352|nr:LysR substrate-binding domain-containing protein [Roseomonas rosulenta]